MGELLLRKALAMRERLARLRAALPQDPATVLGDERLEAFIAFSLFLLIQDAVGIAAHLVAARGLAVPGSQREVFDALAKAGLLTEATHRGLAPLVSLRNRIAHAYGELDVVRMTAETPACLAIVERMLEELGGAIGAP